MASRSVFDLDLRVQKACLLVQRAWADAGHDVILTCTYRSPTEQDALYAQGRTAPGPIVTHARAGQSLHNIGLAIDFVPVVNGKAVWNNEDLFQELARIALATDGRMSWGGSWDEPKTDRPHLEWHLG